MPATTYMRIDPRRDHSIRVPRPDQTVSLGVPNACSRCHTDRSAEWAAERVRGWYGHDPQGFQRFAETFAADEKDAPGADRSLATIAEDSTQPGIVRASALARLSARPGFAATGAATAALEDPDPEIRRAALTVLESLPPANRVDLAAPLLEDRVLAVRLAAVRALAPAATAVAAGVHAEAWRKAEAEYIATQRYNADRPESRMELGSFFAWTGRTAEAVTEYQTALKLAPQFVPAYVNLADLYRSRGSEAEAERTLREGLAVAPEDATLHHALGLSLARGGRTGEAVAELGRAAALAPDDARMAYAYAVALNSTGRGAEAIAALEKARLRHPNDRDILIALSTFNRDAGQLGEARRYAGLLFEANPNDPDARALLQSLGGPAGR
jgi:Flp pilus assembly protein TadD